LRSSLIRASRIGQEGVKKEWVGRGDLPGGRFTIFYLRGWVRVLLAVEVCENANLSDSSRDSRRIDRSIIAMTCRAFCYPSQRNPYFANQARAMVELRESGWESAAFRWRWRKGRPARVATSLRRCSLFRSPRLNRATESRSVLSESRWRRESLSLIDKTVFTESRNDRRA